MNQALDELNKKIGDSLWSIFPDNTIEVYFYVNLAKGYGSYSYSFLGSDGETSWPDDESNKSSFEIQLNVYNLLKEIQKNDFFQKEPWTQCLVTLTQDGEFSIKFAYVPGEDSWPGLEMKGISELSFEEAYNEYSIPKEEWDKRQVI